MNLRAKIRSDFPKVWANLALFPKEVFPDVALGLDEDPTIMNCLVRSLNDDYERSGDPTILEEKINLSRAALTKADTISHSTSLHNFGSALGQKFDRTGNYKVLCEGVDALFKALELRRESHHPRIASTLNELASMLFRRYTHTPVQQDAQRSVALYHEALELRKHDTALRISTANNLAFVLIAQYNSTRERYHLDEAVAISEFEIESVSSTHPLRRTTLRNLAIANVSLAQLSPALERLRYLQAAKPLLTQAVDRWKGHQGVGFPMALLDLGWFSLVQFVHTREEADLESTFRYIDQGAQLVPSDHPSAIGFHISRARAHLLSYAHDPVGRSAAPRVAFNSYRCAVNSELAPLQARMRAAMEWARTPEVVPDVVKDWAHAPIEWHRSSVEAYVLLFQLLNLFLIAVPDVTNHHTCLASLPDSIVSDAAACAIQAGMLETAVELLENGQDLIMANLRILRVRHTTDKLQEANPRLAKEFVEITEQLEHQSLVFQAGAGYSMSPAALEEGASDRRMAYLDGQVCLQRTLLDQLHNVVAKIRGLGRVHDEAWSRFLQPASFETLRRAGAEGPVIILTFSTHRNDVLIIHGDPGVVEHLPLKNVSKEQMSALSTRFKASVRARDQAQGVLDKLKETIFPPISEKLAALGLKKHSRVWWMLPGNSTFLPMHAASRRYVSSYTSNLSTLLHARRGDRKKESAPTLLAVGVSEYTTAPNLEVVEQELDSIMHLSKKGVIEVAVLRGNDAKKERVLKELHSHSSVHFSCHGALSQDDPFESALILSNDQKLTLRELTSSIAQTNSDLAFISACHSASRDTEETPDKRINLATSLQLCGFRSVIGSLFVVIDAHGYRLAQEFYEQKFKNGKDSATALHLAVEVMRKEKATKEWSNWINFIHLGA
ncbi:CHAT domain-containing protein [Mycena metata]|uniref:CHAT domain-containing protein n=1 Tax=Mycena metata TaxID=1033252 RepID=A0AAD7MV02_9AGAR|nr:CHAT domain-containing protein [Mycena metata]